jgi:hypothetical protein
MKKVNYLWVFLLLISCSSNSDKQIETKVLDDKLSTTVSIISSLKKENKIGGIKLKQFILKDVVIDGWLAISEKQTIVEQKIGNADKVEELFFCEATGMFVQVWVYESLGLVLEMESELEVGVKNVRSIKLTNSSSYTLQNEIGIHSRIEAIHNNYKDFIDSEFTDDNHIIVGSVYEGIIFTIESNHISEIFIGAVVE